MLNISINNSEQLLKITSNQLRKIIDEREPRGLFYRTEGDIYIGLDNSTGEAWVEEFPSKDLCFQWLKGEISEVVKCTGCGFDFGWETGNEERGNIYQCEKCGSYICATCILESSLYNKELSCTLDGIAGLEEILCFKCKQ